jgi:flagellar protein FliT
MLAMPSQIDIYEDMSALSARMVTAARAQDWERLVELESAVARLRNALRGKDDNTALDPGEAERKRSLIQSILDNDAEIRRHTEPWMEHVRQFLGNQASRKRVERAYGAGR